MRFPCSITMWENWSWSQKRMWEALELKRTHFTSNSSPSCGLSRLPSYVSLVFFPQCIFFFLHHGVLKFLSLPSVPTQTDPHPNHHHSPSSQPLSNPGAESGSCVTAYGYLTSASPLIRLSSLNDATCGATNATEKSIKALPLKCKSDLAEKS